MKKKLLFLAALPLMLGVTTGCGSKADFNIGILQWVPIEALTKATNGFMDSVREGMGSRTVSFDVKHAYNEATTAIPILNNFVATGKNLIMGNATPSVVLASNATTSIPIVGTSVTTYEGAFTNPDTGVVNIPANVTGTSDLADLHRQAEMIFEWVPDATRIGIVYCVNESNSKFQADTIKAELTTIRSDLTFVEIIFSTTDELTMQLNSKVSQMDVLYIPTDNTCADNASVIHDYCRPVNLPVIAGEEGICKACGLASLTIDYYRLGRITGQMALEILLNGKSPSDLPIRYDTGVTKIYNPTILAELGLSESDVPEGYTPVSLA